MPQGVVVVGKEKPEATPLTKFGNLLLSIRYSMYCGILYCEGDLVEYNQELATRAKRLGAGFYSFKDRKTQDALPRLTEDMFWRAVGVAAGYSHQRPLPFDYVQKVLRGEITYQR